jgi:carbon-monoxide dehydrogenase iron sulfur subunit
MKDDGVQEGLLLVDIGRCLGCRSCELACAVEHSVARQLVAAIAEHPRPASCVAVEGAEGLSIPLQCRHCEDAPCVSVCPTGAMEKLGPNQPVVSNKARCIGCRLCIVACPLGAIRLRSDGKAALKCDLCIERLRAGRQPACVEACMTGALRLASHDEVIVARRRSAAAAVAEAFKSAKAAAKSAS